MTNDLNGSFCREDPFDTFGYASRLGKGSGSRFEDRLQNVVLVRAVKQLDVQIATKLSRKRPPEVLNQLDIKLPNAFAYFRYSINEEGSAAQIHYRAHESFIHRHVSRAEANDSFLIAERIGESLANRERDVFDRMMGINVQIAFAFNLKVEQTVAGKQLEHVIEKADSGSDLRVASAIEIELNSDISLASRSLFICGPGQSHSPIKSVTT
jgi:hypothetical protein